MYNVERFIEKCLRSCIYQNISSSEYEILVVNDGSTDNSLLIASQFEDKYSNIRIISQKNQGLSVARNTGLGFAIGEYVWFLDSDDYISDNCLQGILNHLINGIDLLQIQVRHVYEDGAPYKNLTPIVFPYGISGLDVLERGLLSVPAPFSIYRRQYLIDNDLRFTPGIYHEDCEFKPKAIYFAKKVASCDIICYNYLQRKTGSITSTFKVKRGDDLLFVMNSLISFCKHNAMSKKCKQTIYNLIGQLMNTLMSGLLSLNKTERQYLTFKIRNNKHIFRSLLLSNKNKYIMEGIVLSLNIELGILLYRILK